MGARCSAGLKRPYNIKALSQHKRESFLVALSESAHAALCMHRADTTSCIFFVHNLKQARLKPPLFRRPASSSLSRSLRSSRRKISQLGRRRRSGAFFRKFCSAVCTPHIHRAAAPRLSRTLKWNLGGNVGIQLSFGGIEKSLLTGYSGKWILRVLAKSLE